LTKAITMLVVFDGATIPLLPSLDVNSRKYYNRIY
jgi:hypothetical protein